MVSGRHRAVEIVVDRILDFTDTIENTALDAFRRDLGEEALNQVQP